jgi:hypothetical protein
MLSVPRFIAIYILTWEAIASAPNGPWDSFNLAPSSRTIYPVRIDRASGNVSNAEALVTQNGSVTLLGNYSYVTLDFGKEVGSNQLYFDQD